MFPLILTMMIILIFYLYNTRTFMYWEKRKVKHDKPVPLFGNFLQVFFATRSATQVSIDLYWKYPKEKVVGLYAGTSPVLLIRDMKIIKQILTIDFNCFHARGLAFEKYQMEPMLRNLFHADGDVWRLLRQRMTSAFTCGKLRAMFPLIVDRAERLQARTLAAANSGVAIDAYELMARFSTDFISACGFGLDANSLSEEHSAFRELGKKIFKSGPITTVKSLLKDLFPFIFKNIKHYDDVEKILIALVKKVQEQRKYEPSNRNDFIDLLMECKKQGKLSGESIEKFQRNGTPEIVEIDLDDAMMAAQVFVFFAAGFETSSFSTSFTLHQLAYHPKVQKKVQQEIDTVLAKYSNKLCYEAVKEMSLLSWSFKESMRIFPSVGVVTRKCTRNYEFKDLGFSIDKKIRIMIPIQALHNDPRYFENPEEFRPDRFDPKKFKREYKYVYMPFGVGPRACIGERMGLMQSLSGLAAILSRFTVSPTPDSKRHPVIDPASYIVQSIKGGLPLFFKERSAPKS